MSAGADRRVREASSWRIAAGMGWRGTRAWLLSPTYFAITLLFPLIFLAAFAGALAPLRKLPGFSYPAGYTTFVYGFVALQAAAFGGIFTGYSVARDFEIGMAARLFLATRRRGPILAGYLIVAVTRALIAVGVLTLAALAGGMATRIGAGQVAAFVALIVLVAGAAGLWSCGIAMRLRATGGGPFMYTPILVSLFLAPVYVPASLLHGWLALAAGWNPVSHVIQDSRALLGGSGAKVGEGFLACGVLLALSAVWALASTRRAEREWW